MLTNIAKIIFVSGVIIKLSKPKGQSRMDNIEMLATLGTQDTGRRQTKHNNRTQKTKNINNTILIKNPE